MKNRKVGEEASREVVEPSERGATDECRLFRSLNGPLELTLNDTRNAENLQRSMWSDNLGELNTTEHFIEIKPGSRPISLLPYKACPKTQEL